MEESLIRYIQVQVELKWKEKRANGNIFSSAEDILLDALKEGVIVAVLGRNDERLQVVGQRELGMFQSTGRSNPQSPYPEIVEGL